MIMKRKFINYLVTFLWLFQELAVYIVADSKEFAAFNIIIKNVTLILSL